MTITQSILVATDFSDAATIGLVKAAQLAGEMGSKITVCHVLDPSPLAAISLQGDAKDLLGPTEDIEKAIHEALQNIVEEHFAEVEDTKTALIMSPSADQGICHYASKEGTDLIVIATHGRTGVAHLLIGSVAEKVVRHAPCPVLTIRTPLD